MNSMIKTLVSRNKRRYQEDGFDLDLTYIYPNIIAMGFPAEKLEGVYRNHVDDVLRFLDSKHKDHYRVYNLCTERLYDGGKFHNRVVRFPFDDHHPPPIELIKPFCDDLDVWLRKNDKNVAAIHCKAGKGRTGVMICAYLLHRKKFLDAERCLEYYGKTRTRDGKGVTIPSQRRYVKYYGELIKHEKNYTKTTLFLTGVKFNSIPNLNNGAFSVFFEVASSGVKLGVSQVFESPSKDREKEKCTEMKMMLSKPVVVCGDICVDFFHKPPRLGKKERIFQCWFNTFFVQEDGIRRMNTTDGQKLKYLTLEMTKAELDKANKDKVNKIYKPDFKVVFYFETMPDEADGTNSSSSSNGCPGSLSQSHTLDSIHSSPSTKHDFPGRYAHTHRYSNIEKLSVPQSINKTGPSSDVTDSMGQLRISGTSDHGASRRCTDVSAGPVMGDVGMRRPVPASSQSYPDQLSNRPMGKTNRQGFVEPLADRKGQTLLTVDSSSSITSVENASVGEPEDNFSDTDTDDEWEGCEVTVV